MINQFNLEYPPWAGPLIFLLLTFVSWSSIIPPVAPEEVAPVWGSTSPRGNNQIVNQSYYNYHNHHLQEITCWHSRKKWTELPGSWPCGTKERLTEQQRRMKPYNHEQSVDNKSKGGMGNKSSRKLRNFTTKTSRHNYTHCKRKNKNKMKEKRGEARNDDEKAQWNAHFTQTTIFVTAAK